MNWTNGDCHLQFTSPCVNAGNNAYVTGAADADGLPRIVGGTVDIGAFEFPNVLLSAAIHADYLTVAPQFPVTFTATFVGYSDGQVWDFGDGTTVSNQLSVRHGWAAPGDHVVTFTAFNHVNPTNVSATVTVHVLSQLVSYVSAASANSVAPFTSWSNAAVNIQDAVDAVSVPGSLVLVTNGVYNGGGSSAGRVTVTKPVLVASVNGAAVTVIEGNPLFGFNGTYFGTRCAFLASNAVLSGFTLTQGGTTSTGDTPASQGAGAYCEDTNELILNCVITGNSSLGAGGGAVNGTLNNCVLSSNLVAYYVFNSVAGGGGGAMGSVLNNCLLFANSVVWSGGGAWNSVLNNCTVVNNSDGSGAALENCSANNSIAYYNSGPNAANSTLNYSCTTPDPGGGIGNIIVEPLLVDRKSVV